MAMHQDFADWYRRVQIEPKEADLEKRWEAIAAFHKTARPSDLFDAARVFFGLPPKDEDFLRRYRNEFKTADAAFPMRDNDAELRVLTGATLVNNFREARSYLATLSALSLVCGACEGFRKAPVPEIVDLARLSLREQSAAWHKVRKKASVPDFGTSAKAEHLKTVLGCNFQSLQKPLMDVIHPLVTLVTYAADVASRNATIDILQQEESDILWWLFVERSRDLEMPFAQLKSPSGCLIGAKEIAELTRLLPGPLGVEAYLHKMLGLAHAKLKGRISLSDAVAACPLEWQRRFVAMRGLDSIADLCPIHLASQKYIEAGGKTTVWPSPFQTVSGLKSSMKFKPVDLALQAYRERLFATALDALLEELDEC